MRKWSNWSKANDWKINGFLLISHFLIEKSIKMYLKDEKDQIGFILTDKHYKFDQFHSWKDISAYQYRNLSQKLSMIYFNVIYLLIRMINKSLLK